jgi:hypothetical protein
MLDIKYVLMAVLLFLATSYGLEYVNNKKNPEFTIKNFIYKNITNVISLIVVLFIMIPQNTPYKEMIYTDDPF